LLAWGRSALGWIFKDWRHILIAVLSMLAAYWHLDAAKANKHADKAVAALERANKTIADMTAASEAAKAAQIALNKAVTDKQTQIARLTDANETNRLKLADAANRYAGRMRFANHCPAGTNTATESSIADSSDRPDSDAVILSRADFDILNGNTARLMDVKAWGDKLIAEGLAVPVSN
jgi:hypothetical protein